MDQKCLVKLTRLKTELEKQKSELEFPNGKLNFAKILESSDNIKRTCGKEDHDITRFAKTIEDFKKDLNAEIQNRLQTIIDMVETVIQNNKN